MSYDGAFQTVRISHAVPFLLQQRHLAGHDTIDTSVRRVVRPSAVRVVTHKSVYQLLELNVIEDLTLSRISVVLT